MRYEVLTAEMKNLLKENEITWDEHKGYVSNLHKDFYLKDSEAKSEASSSRFAPYAKTPGHNEQTVNEKFKGYLSKDN